MPFHIWPIQPRFAGEVFDLDLRQPLTNDNVAAIHVRMDTYAVIAFHGQHVLTNDDQVAFTRRLGPLHMNIGTNTLKPEERRLDYNFADVGNLDVTNRIWAPDNRRRLYEFANRLWHSDGSFRAIPTQYSLLFGHTVPPAGGNTEFADMRAAYDALDDRMKAEIDGLICEHSVMYSRQKMGFSEWTDEEKENFRPVRQPLVRVHPSTGRKSLFLSSHIGDIVGWYRPEALALLHELTEHATQRQFVHVHTWTQGDLMLWDNRSTMHRGTRYEDQKYVRDMRRTTTMCDAPTLASQAA